VSDGPLEYLFSLQHFGIKFGLGNIRTLLAALDHPERAFAAVHVAGTNGKGSVSAIVDAGLRAAGHRSGLYTSPHLVDLTERFVIEGRPVPFSDLVEVMGSIRDVVVRLIASGSLQAHPTFFEVTTAAAFELFRRAALEVAVCEVGLGGRLDATNVLSPVATAITTVARDHEQHLGTRIEEIAREKAGIIKPGVPVVIGIVDGPAEDVISSTAAACGAPMVRAVDGVEIDGLRAKPDGRQIFDLTTPARAYGPVELALAGLHQVDNAVVAVRLLERLDSAGVHVSREAVRRGLASVRWRGRLERIMLEGGTSILLDAAHNPAGAAALARFLEAQRRYRALVFGVMRDKDARTMLAILAPLVEAIVLTRPSNPRSADPATLAEMVRTIAPGVHVAVEDEPVAALNRAWAVAPDIVVAGSIFLLGDVLKALGST
jgi:dihydrofolate synthase/folylpolyglutamate synthase